VRAIVEVAEASAAAIEQGAQDEAARIRSEAQADARQTRDEAVRRSQEQVGQVGSATKQMLQRVDAMQSELNGLVEALRTGSNRLTADLSLLEGGMGDLYDAAGRGEPGTLPSAPRVVESVPMPVATDEPAAAPEGGAVANAATTIEEPAPDDGETDSEGARLVALNMALNGTAREETDRYLAENFHLADRGALLDEVYATVES
jgi:hypothetical protein